MAKPYVIFDGDCGFCRTWVRRWKHLTGDQVDYIPAESGPLDSIQLIETDGRKSKGAEAVFRVLNYAGHSSWLWAYEKVPGFARTSEWAYSLVAGHRPFFSSVTKPTSYRLARWIFLRALAIIYAIAFASFGVQVKGLVGSNGIAPVADLLARAASVGHIKFWYLPSFAWISSSDTFLVGMCVAGVIFSILLLVNLAPRLSLFFLWALYLSLCSIGNVFMSYQWDALLLEAGFLAFFLAPRRIRPQKEGALTPSFSIIFLFQWLLFRLMFQSAVVKWLSGDVLWHHFAALTVHYQTQPLPNPLSWYAHQLPGRFQYLCCIGMFIIEGIVPFFIFTGRRLRIVAFWAIAGFQVLIFLTGNYTFFNLLAIALCVFLLDDATLRPHVPAWFDEPISKDARRFPATARVLLTCAVLYLTGIPFLHTFGVSLPESVIQPYIWLSPLESFNGYGLFAVMTPSRPEIIVEGSNDAKTWQAYEFKYKPGDPSKMPPQVAPYQPRLDWQMWFAALGNYRQNPWFINFCIRLLQGSKPVLDLLGKNPFPDHPPKYVRASLYEYRFTTRQERRQTGNWWARTYKGLYCPILSLKNPSKTA